MEINVTSTGFSIAMVARNQDNDEKNYKSSLGNRLKYSDMILNGGID